MKKTKVIILCPSFHGYETSIIDTIKKKDFTYKLVTYDEQVYFKLPFPIRLSLFLSRKIYDFFGYDADSSKSFCKVRSWLMYRFCGNKFNRFIAEELNNYQSQHLLVIKGHGLTKDTVNNIRADNKVLYQWDSLIRIPKVKNIYKVFDKVFTFDKFDSESGYGEYLPNFYLNTGCSRSLHKEKQYDLFFVGEYTKKRYDTLLLLRKHCDAQDLSHFFHLYCKSGVTAINKDMKIVSREKIDRIKYNDLLERSRSIVEIIHNGQHGYTQRVLEALRNGQLVLTTEVVHPLRSHVQPISEFLTWDKETFRVAYSEPLDSDCKVWLKQYEISNWLDILLTPH